MSFATPWLLALAALAAPVVIGYLSRRRDVRRTVSSALLYRAIQTDEVAARRAVSRPQHLVSLALVLVALAALVIGIAGPRLGGGDARTTIVVIDHSASMAARSNDGADGSTRLDRAADELAALARGMSPSDRVALVGAGRDAAVLVAPTRDHGAVVDAARGLRAGGPGRSAADALALADALCAGDDSAVIVLLSDGVGFEAPATRCPVRYVRIGDPARNVGISAFSVREADGFGLAEVYLAVSSSYEDARSLDVSLSVDGALFEVLSVDVPGGGDADRLVRLALPAGAVLTAAIADAGDALPEDDTAHAAIHTGHAVRVLLITARPKSFAAEALALHRRVALEQAAPGNALPPGPFDLIVLEDPHPGELPPAPRVLALGLAPEQFGLAPGTPITDRRIIRWEYADPLLHFVDLEGVHIDEGRYLAVGDGARSLIDTPAGSVAVATTWGDRALVLTGFRVDDSDVALRVAFPNLIANAVEWSGSDRSAHPERRASEASPESKDAAELLAGNVLSASESRAGVVGELGGTATAGAPAPWRAPVAPWRLLVLVAVGLLLVEQLLPAVASASRWRRA